MENAQLYARSNALQKRNVEIVLSEFVPLMKWSDEDVILDVGSGSGDVTRNLLLPVSPEFGQIVGIDCSEKMVKYAQDHFQNERLLFQKMDITDKVILNVFPQGFTKIFSFFCFHWIQNQTKAVSNLYKLLRPGGTCLLLFVAQSPIYKMYERIAKNQRWAFYMNDWEKFVPVHQNNIDPAKDFRVTLENCGFCVLKCAAPEYSYVYKNLHYYRNFLEAINPFVRRMPEEEKNDFMLDCLLELQLMKKLLFEGKFVVKYNVLIAHAQK